MLKSIVFLLFIGLTVATQFVSPSSGCVRNWGQFSTNRCVPKFKCPLKMCNCAVIIEGILDKFCCDTLGEIVVCETERCFPNKVSLSKYICTTLQIIKAYLKCVDRGQEMEMTRILTCIYNDLGSDKKKLALFTSSALHNTSYFTIFRANTKDKYCSRGLLMIKDLENYQELRNISGVDYVSMPEMLEVQTPMTIRSTVAFFKWVMRFSDNTFVNMMKALNPVEYQVYLKSGCVLKNDRWMNRESLYDTMMRVY